MCWVTKSMDESESSSGVEIKQQQSQLSLKARILVSGNAKHLILEKTDNQH